MRETPEQMTDRFWKQLYRDLDPGQRPQGAKGFTFMIDTSRVFDAPDKVRRHLDDSRIADLANSIRERGQVEPITVCRRPEYKRGRTPAYEVIHGHRRVAACRLLQQPVKAQLVKGECRGLNLVLNMTQAKLSGVEIADAIAAMRKDLKISVARTAKMIARSERYVEMAARVAELPADVREILCMRGVPISILFELTALPEAERRNVVAEIARGREFSRAELRKLAAGESKPARQSIAVRAIEADEMQTGGPTPEVEAMAARTATRSRPAGPAPTPAAEPAPVAAPSATADGASPSAQVSPTSAQRMTAADQESTGSLRSGVPGEAPQPGVPVVVTRLTALRQTLAAIDADVLQAVGSNENDAALLAEIAAELERVRDAIKAITAERQEQRRPRLVVRNETMS